VCGLTQREGQGEIRSERGRFGATSAVRGNASASWLPVQDRGSRWAVPRALRSSDQRALRASRPYDDVLCGYVEAINRHARARVLRAVLPTVKSVCDVGCGNGATALELARRGLEVHALDNSPVFCEIVRAGARLAGLRVMVHCDDMRDFTLPRPVDLVLAEFALLNNLPDRRDLLRVLEAVARALPGGGWFCFDVTRRDRFASSTCRRSGAKTRDSSSFSTESRERWAAGEAGLRVAHSRRTPMASRTRDALARLLDRCRDLGRLFGRPDSNWYAASTATTSGRGCQV
jgi:SAM-dependent methyltransferase